MIQEVKRVIELPDREEISLCEAVTAVILGEAINVKEYDRRDRLRPIESESLLETFHNPANKQITPDEEAAANEKAAKLNDFLNSLCEAAYAGRVRFRGIKNYADLADGLKDIDRSYFYYEVSFNWSQDEMSYLNEDSPTIWSCVHVDRDQFASVLKDMGVPVRQPPSLESRHGFASRPPTMKHPAIKRFVLEKARTLLEAAGHTLSKKEVSEQIAQDIPNVFPNGPEPSAKTIRNSPEFRDLWKERERPK